MVENQISNWKRKYRIVAARRLGWFKVQVWHIWFPIWIKFPSTYLSGEFPSLEEAKKFAKHITTRIHI